MTLWRALGRARVALGSARAARAAGSPARTSARVALGGACGMLALGGGAALCSANVEAESDPFQFEALEKDPVALIKRFEDFERCAEARATEAVVARAFGPLTGKTWRLVENEGGEEKMRLDGESWVKRKAQGRKRERNSQLQRLRSRPFSTRFG